MARRILVTLGACALAVTTGAFAALPERQKVETDRNCAAEEAQQGEVTQQVDVQAVAAPASASMTLEALFAALPEQQSVETEDGVGADVGPIEVLLLRRDSDGKPVLACVDNLKAAKRFLKAPVENLPAKQAKDQ